MSRLVRVGDAVSQLLNVVLFDGDPNHSVSGDAYRFRRNRLRRVIDWIFERLPFGLAESEHCRLAYENDVAKGCALCDEQRGRDRGSANVA